LTDVFETLYVSVPVLNAQEIVDWASAAGIKNLVAPESMHITIAYSRSPVDLSMVSPNPGARVIDSGPYGLERFDMGALALLVPDQQLTLRWWEFDHAGAKWDYHPYRSHITVAYHPKGTFSMEDTFTGPISLGMEQYEPLT